MNTAKKAALVLAATGLALGAAAGSAFATGGAQGAAIGSPGILSGNVVQAPVQVGANVCGDSIDAVTVLSPNTENICENN
ncbi:chaplin [Streptomyces sp. NPDC050636]|uniref:chaplin n=1 Tax=Streptomyces sp. NPDC050636 TaxID=3154510 RepID=UPI00342DF7BF